MKKQSNILVISSKTAVQDGLRQILSQENFNVITRESIESTLLLLDFQELNMIICENNIIDGEVTNLIQTVRGKDVFYNDIPILVIGEKNNAQECITYFEIGADEYCPKPLNKNTFLARIKKIIKSQDKIKNNPVSLSIRVEASEAPGILQLLETEKKSGLLKVTYKKEQAEIIFAIGKVVAAEGKFCKGADTLTEILSWNFCQLQFTDQAINEEDYSLSLSISHALMDCVFQVDEYKEVLKRLPDMQSSFKNGTEKLDKDCDKITKKVHRLATSGIVLQDIIDAMNMNRRHLLILIDKLIANKNIIIAPDPFENYLEDKKKYIFENNASFKKIAIKLINCLHHASLFHQDETLESFKYMAQSGKIDVEAPTIFIAGNNGEINEMFFENILLLASLSLQERCSVESSRSNEGVVRLHFSPNIYINLVLIPPKLDKVYIKSLSQYTKVISCIFLSSSHEKESSNKARTIMRDLYSFYKGNYLFLLPCPDKEEFDFLIDCKHCNYQLLVSSTQENLQGVCPICETKNTIPNHFKYARESIKIPKDVPINYIDPTDINDTGLILQALFASVIVEESNG